MKKIIAIVLCITLNLSLSSCDFSFDDFYFPSDDEDSGYVETSGLKLQLNPDGESYTVVDSKGSKGKSVTIDYYDGKPITKIAKGALSSSDFTSN